MYQAANSKTRKANTVKATSQTNKFVDNLLRNHSFENDLSIWTYNSDKVSVTTSKKYLGDKSVCLNPTGYLNQKIGKTSGTYTISAYVKGTSSSSVAQFAAYYYDSDGNRISSTTSQTFSLTSDWTRICYTFSLAQGTTFFRPRITNIGSDNIWVDCVQVENSSVMNPYNLLANGGFENTESTAWSKSNCSDGDGYATDTSYGRSAKITGSSTDNKRFVQKITINKPAKKLHFTISGLAYATSVPLSEDTRKFGLAIHTYFTDGTDTTWYQNFNPDCSGLWQYTSGTSGYSGDNANKTVDYIYVYCTYYHNANTAYFDHIQLNIDETGAAYVYDADGNLISATDNAGRMQTYDYTNANELASTTTADNKKYDYTYSSNNSHRLISATSKSSKIKFSYGYDSFGNVTSSKTQAVDSSGTATGKYIINGTHYSEDGAYVTGTGDDWGHYDTSTYNANKGTLTRYTDRKGNSTSYTYNSNNDNLQTVSDGQGSTVSYTYNGKNYLTKITSPSTQYNFTYDTFGNPQKVKVGSSDLVENNYAANDGNLASSEYGNGFMVSYGYDTLDRMTSKSYNGTKKFTWAYNAAGQIGLHKDLVVGKTYQYSYDLIGRLVRTDVSDGSWFKINYDDTDKTTSAKYHYGPTTRIVDYAYSSRDNLPLSTTFVTSRSVTNTYDGLARLTKKTYATNEDVDDVKTSYTYKNWSSDEDRTTGILDTVTYTTNGGLNVPNLHYLYDKNRNITSVVATLTGGSTSTEGYVYDSKNQLIRHNSQAQGKSFVYEYDPAGNITAKKEYNYTTDTISETTTPNSTISYGYNNGDWGDLLTSYNGTSIGYDNIGNMVSYGDNSLTWQGRQLRSMTWNGNNCSYTYDADGIRTSKTVNGTTTEYFLNGNQILAMKTGDNIMWFFYDCEGNRIGLVRNGIAFYYLYNATGDVIGIVRGSTGEVVATYTYDAWGNCTVANASGYTTGTANPFRYRGYYYDNESGLYYLNSRYYSPELGRFINADGQLNPGVLGYNMFAYCENNPVNGSDPDGNMAWWAAAALGGAAWGVASYLIGNAISGQKSTWKGAAKAALTGAITGVAFSAIGKGIQAVSKAAKAVNGVNVQKAKDFTSEAKAGLKSLDRSSGYTKSTLTAGRNIHKGYKVGLRGAKEFGAVKGIRPDYVDFKKGIIYELKPNNPRGIKQGITQLHKYNEALGGGFKLVLEVY